MDKHKSDPIYESLKFDSHDQFRLVTIEPPRDPAQPDIVHCQLRKFDLNDSTCPYSALSYMWGDPNDTSLIFVNDQEVHKTKNLVSALRHFRKAQGLQQPFLWIDALCIDQGSIPEKNHQVPLMGKIYSGAEEVLVWLGESAQDTPLAVRFLDDWVNAAIGALERKAEADSHQIQNEPTRLQKHHVQRIFSDEEPFGENMFDFPDDPFNTTKWTALNRLLVHKYWTRIWIIQEIILSDNVQCYWGEVQFELAKFLSFAQIFEKLQKTKGDFLHNKNNKDRVNMLQTYVWNATLTQSLRGLSSIYKLRVLCKTNLSLSAIVGYTVESQATDPRDKIYGLLSLAETGKSDIQADYNLTPAQVFYEIRGSRDKEFGKPCHLQACRRWNSWSSNPALAREFTAAGKSKVSGKVISDHRRFAVKGIRGTQITHVVVRQDKEEFEAVLARCYATLRRHFQTLPSGLSPVETLFRTFVQDASGNGPPDHKSIKSEAHARILHEKLVMFATFLELHKDSPSRAVDEEYRLPGIDGFLEQCIPAVVRAPQGFQMDRSLLSVIQGRELDWNDFFVSADGYIGLGTGGMRQGDIVCILSGLHVPAILRPQDDDFLVVGDCYCYGMMHGELIRDLPRDQGWPDTFSLI